eukprot:6974998-Alexandrium_andersonii.AAC.1
MSLGHVATADVGRRRTPLLWSTPFPPMGLLPARAKHSEIGRTPHACQDSMNRASSARAAATSSESSTAPVMSSRYGCPPDSA